MKKGHKYPDRLREPIGMILFSFFLLIHVVVHAANASETLEHPDGKASVNMVSSSGEWEEDFLIGFMMEAPDDVHLRRMKDAGFNAIIYPIFWNRYETDNGVFSSLLLAEIRGWLDYARQIDMQVVLKIQLHPQPEWLFRIYPDLAMQAQQDDDAGEPKVIASIHHAGLRKERNEFLMHLSQEVRSHPALIALHVGSYPLPDFELDTGIHAEEAFRKWNEKNARQAVMQRLGRMEGLADIFRFKAEIEKATQGNAVKIPSLQEIETQRKNWLNWMRFRRETHLEYLSDYFSTLRSLFSQQSLVFTFENSLITDCSTWKQAVFFDEVLPLADIVGVYASPSDAASEVTRNLNRSLTKNRSGWIFFQDLTKAAGITDSTSSLNEAIHSAVEQGMKGVFFQSSWEASLRNIARIEPPSRPTETSELNSAQVAILLDWHTQIQMPNDPFSCSETAALAALLLQEGIQVDFISSHRLLNAGLEGYQVLGVLGTVVVNDEILEKIAAFLDSGGAIIASDRFGERDELFNLRKTPAKVTGGLYLDVPLSDHKEKLREPIMDFLVRQGINSEDTR